MKVRAVSGYGEKGPACFLVEAAGRRLLLDLGEGPQPGRFPDLSGLGPVDAILVSHGHADHIGGLHLAAQLGSPPIHATAIVRTLGGHEALRDAADLPLAGVVEIAGLTVETGRAGHAPGGVWMRIGGEDGLLYSGDLSRESLLYPCDAPPPARWLIADASYGSFDDPLATQLPEIVGLAEHGGLLLPVPPAGRGLEIAVLMLEHGLRPRICRQHRRVAETLLRTAPEALVPRGGERLSALLASAEELTEESRPGGVMLAGNGAASAGVAAALAQRFAGDRATTILFTGHVEADSFGHALIERGQARFKRWNVHPTATDLRWLVDRASPTAMLPAFLAHQRIADLAGALPGTRLAGPMLG